MRAQYICLVLLLTVYSESREPHGLGGKILILSVLSSIPGQIYMTFLL
jgi:hypothetical protein